MRYFSVPECEDKYKLHANYNLIFSTTQSEESSTYIGVTVDVCKELCTVLEDKLCNSFVYEHATKSCHLLNPDARSPKVEIQQKNGTDYYERIRCPSKVLCNQLKFLQGSGL